MTFDGDLLRRSPRKRLVSGSEFISSKLGGAKGGNKTPKKSEKTPRKNVKTPIKMLKTPIKHDKTPRKTPKKQTSPKNFSKTPKKIGQTPKKDFKTPNKRDLGKKALKILKFIKPSLVHTYLIFS